MLDEIAALIKPLADLWQAHGVLSVNAAVVRLGRDGRSHHGGQNELK